MIVVSVTVMSVLMILLICATMTMMIVMVVMVTGFCSVVYFTVFFLAVFKRGFKLQGYMRDAVFSYFVLHGVFYIGAAFI